MTLVQLAEAGGRRRWIREQHHTLPGLQERQQPQSCANGVGDREAHGDIYIEALRLALSTKGVNDRPGLGTFNLVHAVRQ
jgi:hypothetical protein